MRTIDVMPLAEGWRVVVDQVANDLVYRSGGEAERAAQRLARRLAEAGGGASVIRVYLRDGALAARMLCPANAQGRRTVRELLAPEPI